MTIKIPEDITLIYDTLEAVRGDYFTTSLDKVIDRKKFTFELKETT